MTGAALWIGASVVFAFGWSLGYRMGERSKAHRRTGGCIINPLPPVPSPTTEWGPVRRAEASIIPTGARSWS